MSTIGRMPATARSMADVARNAKRRTKMQAPPVAPVVASPVAYAPAVLTEPLGKVVHLVPRSRARVDRQERNRTNTRWGDLSASGLLTVMRDGAKGDIADWVDLCEFMIDTDDLFLSLYETRINRVVQGDWIIAPNKFGDRVLAQKAARLCNELFARIENPDEMLKLLMHAVGCGISNNQLHWDRDRAMGVNFVRWVEHVHGHRFRYDEQWQPRFYDHGNFDRSKSYDMYGEILVPNLWLTHRHQVQAGYPGIAGVMRACALKWLFRRWAVKWEVGNLEVNGRPLVYATVGPNTPDAVRSKILTDLENLSADHYGVMEATTTLTVDATAAASRGWEAFSAFADHTKKDIVTAWLGFDDAVSPGSNGSQSAATTRAGLTIDPRMVADGMNIGQTIRRQLFRPFIELNSHIIGVHPSEVGRVPLPEFRFRTSGDEAQVDAQDLAQEQRDVAQAPKPAGEPAPAEPVEPPAPPATQARRSALRMALRGEL